jgi:hypothetical protein
VKSTSQVPSRHCSQTRSTPSPPPTLPLKIEIRVLGQSPYQRFDEDGGLVLGFMDILNAIPDHDRSRRFGEDGALHACFVKRRCRLSLSNAVADFLCQTRIEGPRWPYPHRGFLADGALSTQSLPIPINHQSPGYFTVILLHNSSYIYIYSLYSRLYHTYCIRGLRHTVDRGIIVAPLRPRFPTVRIQPSGMPLSPKERLDCCAPQPGQPFQSI